MLWTSRIKSNSADFCIFCQIILLSMVPTHTCHTALPAFLIGSHDTRQHGTTYQRWHCTAIGVGPYDGRWWQCMQERKRNSSGMTGINGCWGKRAQGSGKSAFGTAPTRIKPGPPMHASRSRSELRKKTRTHACNYTPRQPYSRTAATARGVYGKVVGLANTTTTTGDRY
jgi:hypothetical protein